MSEREIDRDEVKVLFEALFDIRALLTEIVRLLGGGDGEEEEEEEER